MKYHRAIDEAVEGCARNSRGRWPPHFARSVPRTAGDL